MIRVLLLVTVGVVSSVEALKCHVVAAGNLTVPDTSQPQECGLGSMACVKIIDFTRNTYSKQCQNMNCTMNGLPNAVANCQNTSTFGMNGATCCCYGDGCNAAPHFGSLSVVGLSVAIVSALFAI
uniref:UPAR/Ly6 domain-containing protein n=1 Tax=Caenorhabditis japonica TaxID=281687 RepID=A0A8R1HZI1_CAEJA